MGSALEAAGARIVRTGQSYEVEVTHSGRTCQSEGQKREGLYSGRAPGAT